ncbi:hypothetical protein MP228_013120 [Amoeboaphelidium protococcarum]|nr:hypothetical protein MP228_013120 [Amoeboaphelidium protococcarum]
MLNPRLNMFPQFQIAPQQNLKTSREDLHQTSRIQCTEDDYNIWEQMLQMAYTEEQLRNPFLRDDPGSNDLNPLHIAAGTGNMEMLKRCLNVFRINLPDKEGRTPLIYAVIGNHQQVVEYLIKRDANCNLCDYEGRSPVHWATYYGRFEILRLLLQLGADHTICDNEYRTPLHWATGVQSIRCFHLLLQKSALCQFELNRPDLEQMTISHWAVYNNQPFRLEKILQLRPNVLLTDIEGKTPLHWTVPFHKDLSCAQLLLKYEEKLLNVPDLERRTLLHLVCSENNASLFNFIINFEDLIMDCKDISGRTPVHYAAVAGNHTLIQGLLDRGALDSVQDQSGATALHYACLKNHSQCVTALLSRKTFSYLPDREEQYPLIYAVRKGNVQCVQKLLERDIDANKRDSINQVALHIAASSGQSLCVSQLLEFQCDAQAVDDLQQTALHKAAANGYAECCNILIQGKVGVDQQDGRGQSALHLAAMNNYLTVCSVLLANHVQIDLRDSDGKTALHYAAQYGHQDLVKFLLENRADIEAQDDEQLTALHWAALKGQTEVVRLLAQEGANINASNRLYNLPTPLDFAIVAGQEDVVDLLEDLGAMTLSMFFDYMAIRIQTLWRGFMQRSRFIGKARQELIKQRQQRNKAALVIQKFMRRKVLLRIKLKYLLSGRQVSASQSSFNDSYNSDELHYFAQQRKMMQLDQNKEKTVVVKRNDKMQTRERPLKSQAQTMTLSRQKNKAQMTATRQVDDGDNEYSQYEVQNLLLQYQQQLEMINQQQREMELIKQEMCLKIDELIGKLPSQPTLQRQVHQQQQAVRYDQQVAVQLQQSRAATSVRRPSVVKKVQFQDVAEQLPGLTLPSYDLDMEEQQQQQQKLVIKPQSASSSIHQQQQQPQAHHNDQKDSMVHLQDTMGSAELLYFQEAQKKIDQRPH